MKIIYAIIALTLAADVALATKYRTYRQETERLRAGMSKGQRERADLVIAAERHRLRVELELVRRQARGDKQLHLTINVDSAQMFLERDGVVLRAMPASIGPEHVTGPHGDSTILVTALGQRTVERLLGPRDVFELPLSAYRDRGLPVPEDRKVRGALGERAILLSDGSVVYAAPESGVLSDTTHVLEGSVRIPAADLKAVVANVRPGMPVYFFR